mgnify:CR=1 FL=1
MSQKIANARERLMVNAREFLLKNEEGNLGKFNIRDLTARSGMALGTFYHYFSSKDDLIIQIMEEEWQQIIAEIRPVSAMPISVYEKVRFLYEKLAAFERRYSRSAMLLLPPTPENLAHRKKDEEEMYSLIRTFLGDETDRGELMIQTSLEVAAYMLVQVFFAAARNPVMTFEDLWQCMTFRCND